MGKGQPNVNRRKTITNRKNDKRATDFIKRFSPSEGFTATTSNIFLNENREVAIFIATLLQSNSNSHEFVHSDRLPLRSISIFLSFSIRHNYGKVGCGTSYSPYSCLKIINHIPTSGDHCGCPFKLFSEESLRSKLRQNGISELGISEVCGKARTGDFQVLFGSFYECSKFIVIFVM